MLSAVCRRSMGRGAVAVRQQVRNLSIQEFRSAQLLKEYGVGTPRGGVARSPEEAYQIASQMGGADLVVKAQALTGGRGKGHFDTGYQSGVHMVGSSEEARQVAQEMLNHRLITKQSGDKGKLVSAVYVVERKDASKEAYLSILMDRQKQKPLIICSSEGGMNIEEVAAKNPDAIKKFHVSPSQGLTDGMALEIAKSLGFTSDKSVKLAQDEVKKLYKIFMETDATQIEINPLSQIRDTDEVMCMDAKFGFDDNASFRQEKIYSWSKDGVEPGMEDDLSTVAKKNYDLNFVKLPGSGNIGCLVNGAGLAMATLDVIKLNGGNPANFLDCGGGATPETIEKAFELIIKSSGKDLRAIFVNIFGGIVRCDYVASGIVQAAKNLKLEIPIVARLQGTNLEEGRKIIAKADAKIYSFDELDPAASKVVSIANS